MKYILYCRKSTESEDRQVMSIEAQEREMLAIAKRDDLSVVKILKESQSAKDMGRPVFNELIGLLRSGKADGILAWKLDRLARNFIDGGIIIDMLQRGVIKEIKTYERVCLPSDNVLMLVVEFGMANQYVRDLSTNVKRGNREKLARGEWPNHAPLGYLNDKATKTIAVDREKEKYVVRAFELYATGGYSYKDTSNILYEEGLRTSSGQKVRLGHIQRMIHNPFYSGVMLRDGKYYEGKHQPIISKDLFDTVKKVAESSGRPCPQKHFFPFRGFLRCENCGCALTASLKKGHDYYYCTNGKHICVEHKSYMREVYLYEKIAGIFAMLHFDEELIEILYEAARERTTRDSSYTENILSNLQKQLETLKVKESRLLDSYLAEQIPQELYEAKMLALGNEKVALSRQIAETKSKNPNSISTLEPTKNIFLSSSRSAKEFLDGDEVKKRLILEKLLWNLSFKEKNIVTYQFKSPYDIIARTPKNAPISTLLEAKEWKAARMPSLFRGMKNHKHSKSREREARGTSQRGNF